MSLTVMCWPTYSTGLAFCNLATFRTSKFEAERLVIVAGEYWNSQGPVCAWKHIFTYFW